MYIIILSFAWGKYTHEFVLKEFVIMFSEVISAGDFARKASEWFVTFKI